MSTLRSDDLTPERRQVLALWNQGLTVRSIAKALDVSTQRIYQQLIELKKAGLVEERASSVKELDTEPDSLNRDRLGVGGTTSTKGDQRGQNKR